jgi:hypothetical protein
MPAESIGEFIPMIVDDERGSHQAYVDLSKSRVPSSKAFREAIDTIVRGAGIYYKKIPSLTFLAYGMDMADSDLADYGLSRPDGIEGVVDILTSQYTIIVGNSLSKIEHALTVELPRRAEEAQAVARGDMPSSYAQMLNKGKEDPEESVRSWFYSALSDVPFDYLQYDAVFSSSSDASVSAHDPQSVLRDISDWFEVSSPVEYLDNQVVKRIWNNLWSVRRLMNGQVDLSVAQEYRNPQLIRWFERPLVNPRNLPQKLSGFFCKHGKVSFHDVDAISCRIVIRSSSGDDYSYVYYDALGQLVDAGGGVHEVDSLLKQLNLGEQDDVAHALGMYSASLEGK